IAGPEKRPDSLFQCWGLKRIRVAVTVFIIINALVLLLINSGSRNGSSSGLRSELCSNCHTSNPAYKDIRKDIFHLPLHQNVDMSRYYFPVKNAWCYTYGASSKQSQDTGSCVCKPAFFGKDCGIPQTIWSSSFLEEGRKLGVWVKRRNRPRRLVNVITVTNASQFDFLKLQLDYLGASVDCFVIGYEGSSDLFSKIKEEFSKSPVYFKIVYVDLNYAKPGTAHEVLADSVWKRLSDFRTDDLFIWGDLTAIPMVDVLSFMKLYDGFSEPVKFHLRQLAYNFLWEPKSTGLQSNLTHTLLFASSFSMNSILCLYESKCVLSPEASQFPASVLERFKKNIGWSIQPWTLGNDELPSGWDCRGCVAIADSSALFSEKLNNSNSSSSVSVEQLTVLKTLLKERGFDRAKVQLVNRHQLAELAPKLLLDKPGSLWYFVPFAMADAGVW
ncbi:unnamed protein product, partial [Ixodes hexagonus]